MIMPVMSAVACQLRNPQAFRMSGRRLVLRSVQSSIGVSAAFVGIHVNSLDASHFAENPPPVGLTCRFADGIFSAHVRERQFSPHTRGMIVFCWCSSQGVLRDGGDVCKSDQDAVSHFFTDSRARSRCFDGKGSDTGREVRRTLPATCGNAVFPVCGGWFRESRGSEGLSARRRHRKHCR